MSDGKEQTTLTEVVKMRFLASVMLAAGLMAFSGMAHAQDEKEVIRTIDPIKERTRIDLVLCLDTSNSMDALIDSAKMKLWDIVNLLSTAEPAPEFRVALYSYGNSSYSQERGWVRKDLGLTDDLDMVYDHLFKLTTGGGTEYVARVTDAAFGEFDPAAPRRSDIRTMQLIFVAGNEPATQDPELTLEKVMEKASVRMIAVNTIYCGNPDNAEAQGWRDAAKLAKGKYAAIDTDQTVAIASPFDDELAKLSAELNTTYVGYGTRRREAAALQESMDTNAGLMAPAVAAERAQAKASKLYLNSSWDLVDAVNNNEVKLEEMSVEELPEEMKALDATKRKEFVEQKDKERAEIQKKIQELGNKRSEYVKQEREKLAKAGQSGFDKAIREALVEQAAQHGMVIK